MAIEMDGARLARLQGLKGQMRVAAEYLMAHPMELATQPLRALAAQAGVSPPTLSRAARALGYGDYEALRAAARAGLDAQRLPFAARAKALRAAQDLGGAASVLASQAQACIANIQSLAEQTPPERLEQAADLLHGAGQVLVLGSYGSAGFAQYLAYMAGWFDGRWQLADRSGASLAARLAKMGPGDALFVITKSPPARQSILALQAARLRGVPTLVITDRITSPAVEHADCLFLSGSDSPHFFSSYAATLVLLETLARLLLDRAGPEAEAAIRAAEAEMSMLGENWEA